MIRRLLALPGVRSLASAILGILYRGRGRFCPVCETHFRKFLAFGTPRREGAMCPRCGSLERHRFVWLYFLRRTDLFDGRSKRVLHIAPEVCFQPRFRKRLGSGYVTADIENPDANVKMDVTNIDYPSDTFDVIYCSHVLEHVTDDRRAMRELHRVLSPNGWAILLVPITAERTIEDPSITDPRERLRLFGQKDHVRRYGPDYVDRLREAGFHVTVTTVLEMMTKGDALAMGIPTEQEQIFYCTKTGGP